MFKEVRWNRSSEGFVKSKCGRFSISPEYWGCCNPQNCQLSDRETGKKKRVDTQSDGKWEARKIILNEYRNNGDN